MGRFENGRFAMGRFEIEGVGIGGMCSSERIGQEHADLLAVRAQRAVAGDASYMGTSRAYYEEYSEAECSSNNPGHLG
jgi:hypothetical protein